MPEKVEGFCEPRIVRIRSVEEMSAIENLQKEIWGYGKRGFDSIYPARALFSFSESGGLVAGAVFRDRLVGFSVSWIGRMEDSGEFYLQSQLLGVLNDFRGLDIGYRLKLFQREFAVSRNITRIRWTFDPIQLPNARLNLHKLGAVCRRFRPDYYGNLRSSLVHGSSDRLWAEWFVSSPRVIRRLANCAEESPLQSAHRVIRCESRTYGELALRVPVDLDRSLDSSEVLIEIPSLLPEIVKRDRPLLEEWRSAIREALDCYLDCGYIIDDLSKSPAEGDGGDLHFYHLTRQKLEEVLG